MLKFKELCPRMEKGGEAGATMKCTTSPGTNTEALSPVRSACERCDPNNSSAERLTRYVVDNRTLWHPN